MAGRPRKPVELHRLTGTFRPCRHREREAAPKSEAPIGEPPAHLAPGEAVAWREFVAAAPAGLLTSGDRWALEIASALMARLRAGTLPLAGYGALARALAELGATPASRGRVRPAGQAEPQGVSPWDALAQPVRN